MFNVCTVHTLLDMYHVVHTYVVMYTDIHMYMYVLPYYTYYIHYIHYIHVHIYIYVHDIINTVLHVPPHVIMLYRRRLLYFKNIYA